MKLIGYNEDKEKIFALKNNYFVGEKGGIYIGQKNEESAIKWTPSQPPYFYLDSLNKINENSEPKEILKKIVRLDCLVYDDYFVNMINKTIDGEPFDYTLDINLETLIIEYRGVFIKVILTANTKTYRGIGEVVFETKKELDNFRNRVIAITKAVLFETPDCYEELK